MRCTVPTPGPAHLDLRQRPVRSARPDNRLRLEIDHAEPYLRCRRLRVTAHGGRVADPCAKALSMKLEAIKVACSNCNLRELCLPVGLSDAGPRSHRRTGRRRGARSSAAKSCFAPATVRVAVRRAHRLLQDPRLGRGRPRPGDRLPDGRRVARPRRHQHRPPHLRRGGAGRLEGLRDSLRRGSRSCRARSPTCSTSSTRS